MFNKKTKLAWNDFLEGITKWRIWLILSWQDIKIRYRRSLLGPFWITISQAITIYTMGFLYGTLFRVNLTTYYPFLAAGMLTWSYISQLISEHTESFIASENYLRQMKLPYFSFIFRTISRNIIIFMHNIVVIIPIMIIFHTKVNLHTPLFLVGILFISINAVTYGTIIATIASRYRDISQLVISLIQVIFFITPIMWKPSILPKQYHLIVTLNPFAQFIDLVRAPLLGNVPATNAYITAIIATIIGAIAAFAVFSKYRARIVYWL